MGPWEYQDPYASKKSTRRGVNAPQGCIRFGWVAPGSIKTTPINPFREEGSNTERASQRDLSVLDSRSPVPWTSPDVEAVLVTGIPSRRAWPGCSPGLSPHVITRQRPAACCPLNHWPHIPVFATAEPISQTHKKKQTNTHQQSGE